ncbi:hypothetical protein BZL29_1053 [Mycobacterium kansasii]|uniref:Uncharacterized protein n=1 Tax=Mycobacterium kansasii TaxID=1768 RepID=A0A1V3XW45_MYCKA|nr:hypothetical protein BZL29_1053 [Mycobacterium kansasii]
MTTARSARLRRARDRLGPMTTARSARLRRARDRLGPMTTARSAGCAGLATVWVR